MNLNKSIFELAVTQMFHCRTFGARLGLELSTRSTQLQIKVKHLRHAAQMQTSGQRESSKGQKKQIFILGDVTVL